MEGAYNGWSHPLQDGQIQVTGLSPGKYILRICAISNEEKYKVYEEKSIEVVVARPPWASAWAIAETKKAIGGKDTLLHKYRP